MVIVLLFGGVVFGDAADDMYLLEPEEYILGYMDGYKKYLMGGSLIDKDFHTYELFDHGYQEGYLDSVLGKTAKFLAYTGDEGYVYTTNWKKGFYVDKFGDFTDEAYIRNRDYITGTFSNTVTRNSKLSVTVLASNGWIYFKLYEYENNLVYGMDQHGTILKASIKDQQGAIHNLDLGYRWYDSNLRPLEYEGFELLNDLFMNDQLLKFIIEGQYPTSYSFAIDTTGFKIWHEFTFPNLAQKSAQNF